MLEKIANHNDRVLGLTHHLGGCMRVSASSVAALGKSSD
jgi:hypothetical protein